VTAFRDVVLGVLGDGVARSTTEIARLVQDRLIARRPQYIEVGLVLRELEDQGVVARTRTGPMIMTRRIEGAAASVVATIAAPRARRRGLPTIGDAPPPSGVHPVPKFERGAGLRHDDCERYERCLDDFVRSRLSWTTARCPATCVGYKVRTREADLVAHATSRPGAVRW
jgi:hypothetical protein